MPEVSVTSQEKNEQINSGEHEVSDEAMPNLSYDDLQAKYLEANETAKQHWERILRMQADADNAQRRAERDVSSAHKYALEKFVMDLLPIIDNLERGLTVSTNAEDPVLEGVRMTLKMFQTTLEKFGVVQVNPEGDQFNPEQHQAVSVQPNPEVTANTVLSVLQKGYLLNGRLIRAALVVVSK